MAKDEKFTNSLTLMIRTTINKKRVDVAAVEVPYPTLQDVDSKLSLPDKFQEDEDGGKSPVYEDEASQWAQDAILDAVKREARNVTKVVDMIGNMTVLEVADLVKEMEDKFAGVYAPNPGELRPTVRGAQETGWRVS